MLNPGSGTIRRCGLVEVGVPLVGVGYKTLILAAWKTVFHKQPSDRDVELLALPAPCLPGHCHAPTLMIMD